MSVLAPASARFPATVYRDRLRAAAAMAGERALDALLITPSPDYLYLLGYQAPALERLTCLVVPAEGLPTLVLPRLEEPLAVHELGDLADALEVVTWDETDDPIRLVQGLVGAVRRTPAGAGGSPGAGHARYAAQGDGSPQPRPR